MPGIVTLTDGSKLLVWCPPDMAVHMNVVHSCLLQRKKGQLMNSKFTKILFKCYNGS